MVKWFSKTVPYLNPATAVRMVNKRWTSAAATRIWLRFIPPAATAPAPLMKNVVTLYS